MKVRVLSAIIMLLLFVPLLIIGGIPFALLMLVISLIGLHEIFKVKRKQKEFPFLMELYEETKDNGYKEASDRAVEYSLKTQMKIYNWEGQFEDIKASSN